MADRLRPADASELGEIVRAAAAAREPLELLGGGTKRALGRPSGGTALDLSRLSSVVAYEPEELVLTARAATTLADIERLLAQSSQMLAFEPPDLAAFYGVEPERQTLGGVLACNLSGPRRVKAGAARDHFLGVSAVNGRGETFKAGGRVVKNVTGYDLCKLLAGSFGTLAAFAEATVKVLPAAEGTATLFAVGLDDAAAMRALTAALSSPFEVTGAAHAPAGLARALVPEASGCAATLLRIEGPEVALPAAITGLRREIADAKEFATLTAARSRTVWRAIRDLAPFGAPDARPVWRLALAPASAAAAVAALGRNRAIEVLYDWGGARVWVRVAEDTADAAAAAMHEAARAAGGHAMVMRGDAELRRRHASLLPESPALRSLTRRLKQSFDPLEILNPGRMYGDA